MTKCYRGSLIMGYFHLPKAFIYNSFFKEKQMRRIGKTNNNEGFINCWASQ